MKKIAVLSCVAVLVLAALVGAGCGADKPAASTTAPKIPPKAPIKKVTAGDIQVAYRTYGKGYPLVMIMGYSGTMDTWDPNFVASLAKKYEVFIFDNRGMGETTAGTKQFTIPQFAQDTAAFMDALNIKTAHVLGWSMGSTIAQELVLQFPQKVNRLTLYAADCGGAQAVPPSQEVLAQLINTSGTPQERGQRLIMLLFPPKWLSQPKNMAYIRATLGASSEPTPQESVSKQIQAEASWGGSYDRLPAVKSPTLMLTGAEDLLTPPQNSVIIAGRIPGAWLMQYPGAGHGLQFQYPDQAAASILNFLASP
ncbi:MAG: alpha/beta fold hydrolase [Candidatus Geothermincolia bacterium]